MSTRTTIVAPADVIDDKAILGSVVQKWTLFSRSFYVLDDSGALLLEISTNLCNPYNFRIFHNGAEVGEIKRSRAASGKSF